MKNPSRTFMAVAVLIAACSRGGQRDSRPAQPTPPARPAAPPPSQEPAPAPSETAPPARPAPPVASVTLGAAHGCALLRDHTVRCWGTNATGQLGDGTTTDRRLPLPVTDLEHVVSVSAGASHTCAALEDGTARCWGDNRAGQLGDGTHGEHDLAHAVDGLADAVEIAAGASHTCARQRQGSVMCWGEGSHGELGDGSSTSREHPVPVRGVSHAVQIVAGDGFSCARLQDGGVRCWGGANPLRSFGETARAPIGNLHGAISIAANGSALCVALAANTIRCFDVFANPPTDPPETRALHGVEVTVSGGAVPHFVNGLPAAPEPRVVACALAADGTVACGGDGDRGQLGDGSTHRAGSVAVRDLRDVAHLVAGGETVAANGHACGVVCAIRREGSVLCWGCNEHGVVGDGTVTDRATPTAMSW